MRKNLDLKKLLFFNMEVRKTKNHKNVGIGKIGGILSHIRTNTYFVLESSVKPT